MPEVSVIMPMRNAAAFVGEAVRSVLSQDGVDLELIVVDDGSTDGSADKVRRVDGDGRARIVPGPCAGIAAAFNAGLAAARAAFVARCDADDRFPPGRLAEQVGWMRGHPAAGAVCGRFATMSVRGEAGPELECGGTVECEITGELLSGEPRTHLGTYLARREVVARVGGCREYFVTAEDLDLQFRLAAEAPVWYVPRPWYLYRVHDASITHQQADAKRRFYEEMARAFARQRREAAQDDLERGQPPAPPDAQDRPSGTASEQWRGQLLGAAWRQHAAGDRLGALKLGLRAWRLSPLDLQMWRSVAALVAKPVPRAGGQR